MPQPLNDGEWAQIMRLPKLQQSTAFTKSAFSTCPATPVSVNWIVLPKVSPLLTLRVLLMVWAPLKMLLAASCGTIEVLMARLPLVVIGPPVRPNPLPTLVTVPAPGKVWPATNVTFPVLLTAKAVPETNSVGCANLGNNLSVSRKSPVPLTSSLAAGVVVATPTLPPMVSKIMELPRVVGPVHRGTKFAVPVPPTVNGDGARTFPMVVKESGLLLKSEPAELSEAAEDCCAAMGRAQQASRTHTHTQTRTRNIDPPFLHYRVARDYQRNGARQAESCPVELLTVECRRVSMSGGSDCYPATSPM